MRCGISPAKPADYPFIRCWAGGPTRDRVRLYASGYLCQPRHFDLPGDDLAAACKMRAEQSFTACNFTSQPDDYQGKSPDYIHRAAVDRVATVREAVGDDFDICLDYHGRSFSVTESVRLAQDIERYRPFFLEEPVLTENPAALVEAKLKTTIPIAGGGRCVTREQLKELLNRNALHIFQPEPTCNGGILETVKWAYMCEIHQVVLAPHQACGPVSLLVNCHIDCSVSNFLIQECNANFDDPFIRELFSPLPEFVEGHLIMPDRPGLGIEFNEEAAAKYSGKPYDRPIVIQSDGSIGLE